jgi:hypothetical protein
MVLESTGVELSDGEWKDFKYNNFRRTKASTVEELLKWLQDRAATPELDGGFVVAQTAMDNSVASVFSSHKLLTKPFAKGSQFGIDINHTHLADHCLICVGATEPASIDSAFRFHPIAFAITPGGEKPVPTDWAVDVIDEARRARGMAPLGRRWLCDGSGGIRKGLDLWKERPTSSSETQTSREEAPSQTAAPNEHRSGRLQSRSSILSGFADVTFADPEIEHTPANRHAIPAESIWTTIPAPAIVHTTSEEAPSHTTAPNVHRSGRLMPTEEEHIQDEPASPKTSSADDFQVRMCYFHVVCNVREKYNLLPHGKDDLEDCIRDVRRLAATPDEYFPRAWEAVASDWVERGWTPFLDYFHKEWIVDKPGWNMSDGLPRTNNGLEGLWPILHLLAEGKGNYTTLADCLLLRIIPYFHSERSRRWQMPVVGRRAIHSGRGLTLREKQEAVRLAVESTGPTMIHYNGKWYCKLRPLGLPRPAVLDEDVQAFNSALENTSWTYDDFTAFHAVRQFDANACLCANGYQSTCYHKRCAAIIKGLVTPQECERPPVHAAVGVGLHRHGQHNGLLCVRQ